MPVPLLDLKRDWPEIREEVEAGWRRVTETMRLLNGENLLAFEEEVARFFGARFAFGVGSGTAALWLALLACGVGPGDEVLIQANGFVADVEAVLWAGARPVLVESEEEFFGPDPEAVERALGPRTKALIVVHMYGHPARIKELSEICARHGLILIEDASHAHGAEYQGRKVGTFGKVGCFSCGPVKNLNALGDAGFVLTDDEEVAYRLRYLRVHGQVRKNDHQFYGFNSRLDEIQAVVLRARLKRLSAKNERRREIAELYRRELSGISDLKLPPKDGPERLSVYHRFVVFTPRRDELQAFLKERGIGTGVYYPIPLHLQPAWRAAGFPDFPEGTFPVAERLCREGLALPMFAEMTEGEIQEVIEAVKAFFR
ncbi:DegT/DnrJ/EryC1/StrS family aminotransferase [Thermosulfurimonas marina]|uniref:DegT/DnrJ/EryC1/StrS family aminotransferase n=1 Tax=Thermosulfurimonas marina TaxID=2047767 RepID=A0A6H1WT26_9BACT|nr:DegT/DnrJ/EryC1/StrS family aminotransferase [Thermosulfurimonas marina]QJA06276.1 DegT/DnrJ/EryC1/StrS family aminotransferase [Thermosulfurimonas marina]